MRVACPGNWEAGSENEIVRSYLQKISVSVRVLAGDNDDSMDLEVSTKPSSSPSESHLSLDRIARDLLRSSFIDMMELATENLPAPNEIILDQERDIPLDESGRRTLRRTDYLRILLRAMAPVAMDVAAHVCSILVTMGQEISSNMPSSIPQEYAVAAFIIFSIWLPIAPHISPLVTDLFASNLFPCPINNLLDEDSLLPFTNLRKIVILLEASHSVCRFYSKRGDIKILLKCWNWSSIFGLVGYGDQRDELRQQDMDLDIAEDEHFGFHLEGAIRWYAPRIVSYLLDLAPMSVSSYLEQRGVRRERVPWQIHPWIIDQEEANTQQLLLKGQVEMWGGQKFSCPSSEVIRRVIPIHPWLIHLGVGVVFVKYNPVASASAVSADEGAESDVRGGFTASLTMMSSTGRQYLIRTPTTAQNLSILGAALCSEPHPPPLMVCGPHGAGKSALIREIALLFNATTSSHREQLLEIHVDEETDAKTLIGSYTMSDVPGEFTWKPGALTQAARTGKWVLLEDIDTVPMEIQAALVKLLEDRVLPLGISGKMEHCHPNFRLLATLTKSGETFGTRNRKILNHSLWRKVHVNPLPVTELREIAGALYPCIPTCILESALEIFNALDSSGREVRDHTEKSAKLATKLKHSSSQQNDRITLLIGRQPSVRDFFKLLSRIGHGIVFEIDATYATETQRTACMAESVEVFLAACPWREKRRELIRHTFAPIWGLTADHALDYIETRRPLMRFSNDVFEVGRIRIDVGNEDSVATSGRGTGNFAETSYALRLMESIAESIRENEPLLLVGETGAGKTTILQRLANYSGRDLVVQNLSLQTDSTDLLGGYRPLEVKQIAHNTYKKFVDIFTATFSRRQNAEFLGFAANKLAKKEWKQLSQCFIRAAKLGMTKITQRDVSNQQKSMSTLGEWEQFRATAERFERQRLACESGLAFEFTEGALVHAIREGKWVLLDEINLASSEILQRLCGLLDDRSGSLTLTERGDAVPVRRHPNFRIFGAMNPSTDAGKKELNASIRSRFTELFVDELLEAIELRLVASKYLDGVLQGSDKAPEQNEVVISSVDVYLKARELAENTLVDGSGHKPRYTLRTLARALGAARALALQQGISLQRAILEGFELALQGPLDASSVKNVQSILRSAFGEEMAKSERDHPGRRPGKSSPEAYVLIKPFWIKAGPLDPVDWSKDFVAGRSKFILTPSASVNLRRLARAIAAGPWPVLLEGPTSAGKTTLVEYIAARCGHRVVRINNHEHTDVQEYTGSFAPNENGSLSFQDGILVKALKRGEWVILDELNLAPTEVLEALNRLLDDNRELYLPEINQTVSPHPNFRLFATQNPSGAYGGRKPLSRAFRNRFVELFIADIPSTEMTTILEKRCSCPPSHAQILVEIMTALRHRRSRSGVFLGKNGLITPRDLLRWAERRAASKLDFARDGYFLLAERLRFPEEQAIVRAEIEKHFKLSSLDLENYYFGKLSASRRLLKDAGAAGEHHSAKTSTACGILSSIAPTKSILRLLSLTVRCMKQHEPILLVGETGCGKTTVVELLGALNDCRLQIVNCHATTETSDLIGGLRPVRGREHLAQRMLQEFVTLLREWPDKQAISSLDLPDFILVGFEPETDQSIGMEDIKPDLPEDAVPEMLNMTRLLSQTVTDYTVNGGVVGLPRKRQKVSETSSSAPLNSHYLGDVVDGIEKLYQRHAALFEWVDGSVVEAMRSGHMILLDEVSLAEDAVLERLNSILEPTRTLVLAEKSDELGENEVTDSRIVVASDGFQVFATMNPGGDYGKRELSPALRSRFTEIWVPAVDDMSDIELVLRQTLMEADEEVCANPVLKLMLQYVEWFNGSICKDASGFYAGLQLTLRDVQAWANFIIRARQRNPDILLWDAYCHGVSLMHLDGLGLGSGLAVEVASSLRERAQAFLLRQVPTTAEVSAFTFQDGAAFAASNGHFGRKPFLIPLGQQPICNPQFNFGAKRTAENITRVLRAMQISKPILLEGSPGVGKTSLVSALASASGHRLVRINLSEQSDMSDLFGSDLPIPDGTGGHAQTLFRWSDGVLLSAIKNGDWVLLDELNLAPQSVLEGLNSCLDYRANVFITELGREFVCPPTFKVFAAQNPLTEGGGRKGLPKSFLNRFTKVHVAALESIDFLSIVRGKYPAIPEELVRNMVAFNEKLNDAVSNRLEFGNAGSPWEFNLRDINRWCDLFVHTRREDEFRSCADCARDIYLQRFRSVEDRAHLNSIYRHVFGSDILMTDPMSFRVTNDFVRIGATKLVRRQASVTYLGYTSARQEPSVFQSLLHPLEAVAKCVVMSWPCLLVGPSGSGKSSLLQALAESCNQRLEEVTLSPSSDVSELIGSFEQIDAAAEDRDLLNSLLRIGSEYLVEASSRDCGKVFNHMFILEERLDQLPVTETCILRSASISTPAIGLAELLDVESRNLPGFRARHWEKIREAITRLKAPGSLDQVAAHFRWVDGVLTRAMLEGSWLLLENVNLCPSAVLDRLNPVMEQGGGLLLAECGSNRMIKVHHDFRIFLTMNSEHGECSRALRNRTVEIGLLSPESRFNAPRTGLRPNSATIDCLDVIWRSGLRQSKFAVALMDGYIRADSKAHDVSGIKSIAGAAGLASSLIARGLSLESILEIISRIFQVYSGSLSDILLPELDAGPQHDMVTNPSFRSGWLVDPQQAQADWDGRLLRLFLGWKKQLPYPLVVLPFSFRDHGEAESLNAESSNAILFRNFVAILFLAWSAGNDVNLCCDFLGGIEDHFAETFCFICNLFLRTFPRSETAEALVLPTVTDVNQNDDACDGLGHWPVIQFLRLPHQMTELTWQKRMQATSFPAGPVGGQRVLDVAYYIDTGQIDRSSVHCRVTPLLLPLFRLLDDWISHFPAEVVKSDTKLVNSIYHVLLHRDRLWRFLQESTFSNNDDFQGAFDETMFLILWQWLKKSLSVVSGALGDKRETNRLVEEIDTTLFGGGLEEIPPSIWSKAMHPIAPRNASQWASIECMRKLAESCSEFSFVVKEQNSCQNVALITLNDIVAANHPALYIRKRDKVELLLALCMAHWSSTDEISGKRRQRPLPFSVKVSHEISTQWDSHKNWFIHVTGLLQIDTAIQTVDNLDCISKLEQLELERSNRDCHDISHAVLFEYGRIQISPCAESRCAAEEVVLLRTLCKILLESPDDISVDLLPVVDGLSNFLDNVVSSTTWPVSDLRPYQTLLWACESSGCTGDNLNHLLRNLLPIMFSARFKHASDSCNNQKRFSAKMEMPTYLSDTKDFSVDSVPQQLSSPFYIRCAKAETIFSLIGSLFSQQRSTFCTIENHVARRRQSADLISILSAPKTAVLNGPFELNYLLYDTMNALSKRFPDASSTVELLSIIQDPEKLRFVALGEVRDLVRGCVHATVQILLDPVIVPLFETLRRLWLGEARSQELHADCSLLYVYIGLLRFHLLLPSSPIDPGRKSVAKKVLYERQVNDLHVLADAEQLHSLFRNASPPRSAISRCVVQELKRNLNKMEPLEDRVVERHADAPPFIDVVRETKEFASNFASQDIVLSLVGLMQSAISQGAKRATVERLTNWLRTSGAFCDRLELHYSCYHDIVLPLCDSLRMIRNGISELAANCLRPPQNFPQLNMSVLMCLRYPVGNVSCSDLEFMNDTLNVLSAHSTQATIACCRAFAFAALSRISLRKLLLGLDKRTLYLCCTAFATLVSSNGDDDNYSTEIIDPDKAFHDQFPDHKKEFLALVEESNEDSEDLKRSEVVPSVGIANNHSPLSPYEVETLVWLHRSIFSDTYGACDNDRCDVVRRTYGAAVCFYNTFEHCRMPEVDEISSSSHVMAISLVASDAGGVDLFSSQDTKPATINFYRGPWSSEVVKAAGPLERLLARLRQLVTAFPGNDILHGILKVVELTRKLDVHSTPLGKVMAGLEVILRYAQDWEQHASDRVRLGGALLEVSKLVAAWRKLEVQSWEALLYCREQRFVQNARRHWVRIYKVLHQGKSHGATGGRSLQWSPQWPWKGLMQCAKRLAVPMISSRDDLLDLAKTMDTFFLTSSIGEFSERLALVLSFAKQLRREGSLVNSRLLVSLYLYYRQFEKILSSKLEELKRPLESKLRDQIKLAKWDEQSYYAFAESKDRNLRNLMRVIREYDDVLALNVGSMLDDELCNGIRNNSHLQDESSVIMPSDASFFPLTKSALQQAEPVRTMPMNRDVSPSYTGPAVDYTVLGLPSDSQVLKIHRYTAKMNSLMEKEDPSVVAWSRAGSMGVGELCDSIFCRIEALRGSRATKKMKERALVDLFKTLKRNGFMCTKWSVPRELREMSHLLQLPFPMDADYDEGIGKFTIQNEAEMYFQRFLAEINRFRTEAKLLGSKYLSQREVEIMLGYSEHGLLLCCQQRCLLAGLLADYASLNSQIKRMKYLSTRTVQHEFWVQAKVKIDNSIEGYVSAMESIRQLSLLLKISHPLLPNGAKASWAADTHARIDAHCQTYASLETHIPKYVETNCSYNSEWSFSDARKSVSTAHKMLIEFHQQNRRLGCLPDEAITSCIEELKKAEQIFEGPSTNANITQTDVPRENCVTSFHHCLADAVKCVLVAVQGANVGSDVAMQEKDDTIWRCHSNSSKEWADINLKRLVLSIENLCCKFQQLYRYGNVDPAKLNCCNSLVSDVAALYQQATIIFEAKLYELVSFHRDSSKLQYILVRIFRTLVSKGYCSDEVAQGGEGEEGKNSSGMTFEDNQEGTGMAPGEGAKDVTDQIENEEQLLGLKDEKDDDASKKESKQLGEEEAEQGMEMEGDFDGEMYDIPETKQGDDELDEHDKEELDREMGLDDDPNQKIVDEKMWGNSDDEDEAEKLEEKLEHDSGVTGGVAEEEMRTKDNDDDGRRPAESQNKNNSNPAGEGSDAGSHHDTNEDVEDLYEEGQGVDVRNDNANDDSEEKDPFSLDDHLKLEADEMVDDAPGHDHPDENEEDTLNPEMPLEKDDIGDALEDSDGGNEGSSEFPDSTRVDNVELISDGENDDDVEKNYEAEDQIPDIPRVDKEPDAALQAGLGIMASDGKDACQDVGTADDHEGVGKGGANNDAGDQNGCDIEPDPMDEGGNGAGARGNDGFYSGVDGLDGQNKSPNIPNPFKTPGDATKFWHRRLNMIESSLESNEPIEAAETKRGNESTLGDYEYAAETQADTSQVLGEVAEDMAVALEQQKDESGAEADSNSKTETKVNYPRSKDRHTGGHPSEHSTGFNKTVDHDARDQNADMSDASDDDVKDETESSEGDEVIDKEDDNSRRNNVIYSDLSRLYVQDSSPGMETHATTSVVDEEYATRISNVEAADALLRWSHIRADTHNLALRLCEKLRLVMEPLIASKLRGDYRTGKRINMKRVIGYIASGFRKDKIWLRRTNPAKRNYRVLVAVDDSESMLKTGAGEMAMKAMATLAMGMSQLEIGELAIASFGDDMKLLHPFHLPFTPDAGVNIVQNFKFDQSRTRMALCVESTLSLLDTPHNAAALQLVFLISDGKIERDSRSALKTLIREMLERNILVAMIIVEGVYGKGKGKTRDSIIDMKEVTFAKGKPNIKKFIDDYPFPYYIVLDDMQALPEVLGDALRQWFEMLSQLAK